MEALVDGAGQMPDPRSFCIGDSLYKIAHGGDVEDGILFSGSSAYKFKHDQLLQQGKLPSVKELIEDLKKSLA